MKLKYEFRSLELAQPFKIARTTFNVARVVDVIIEHDGFVGKGQGIPQPRFGDTIEVAERQLRTLSLERTVDRYKLRSLLPAGAARNAVDSAMWDIEARRCGLPAWKIANLKSPTPIHTAITISLGSPREAFEQAQLRNNYHLIKVKLGGDVDIERLEAIRSASPHSRLIADVNEAWDLKTLREMSPHLSRHNVELIEQPLPDNLDSELRASEFPFYICADESFSSAERLDTLGDRYNFINIKLDKLGGLTTALEVAISARSRGVGVMVGCGVGSSLSLAPALLVAQLAEYADLDGPMFLKNDITPKLIYETDTVSFPAGQLWGW